MAQQHHDRTPAAQLPVARPWFHTEHIDSNITLLYEPHVHEVIRCNVWHVRGRDAQLVVDTGLGIARLRDVLPDALASPIAVATHGHYDHVGSFHEFSERAMHRAEMEWDSSELFASLMLPAASPLDPDGSTLLLTALPDEHFDPVAYRLPPLQPTRLLEEGDTFDLGDRTYEVLHLAGHSPGSIGLWDAASGVLFSGDAIYDGTLFDTLPGSNVAAYITTMKRLRELPVSVVHSGHGVSFGRTRLMELATAYLKQRDR